MELLLSITLIFFAAAGLGGGLAGVFYTAYDIAHAWRSRTPHVRGQAAPVGASSTSRANKHVLRSDRVAA